MATTTIQGSKTGYSIPKDPGSVPRPSNGSSQPPLTPVPGNLTASSGLCTTQAAQSDHHRKTHCGFVDRLGEGGFKSLNPQVRIWAPASHLTTQQTSPLPMTQVAPQCLSSSSVTDSLAGQMQSHMSQTCVVWKQLKGLYFCFEQLGEMTRVWLSQGSIVKK